MHNLPNHKLISIGLNRINFKLEYDGGINMKKLLVLILCLVVLLSISSVSANENETIVSDFSQTNDIETTIGDSGDFEDDYEDDYDDEDYEDDYDETDEGKEWAEIIAQDIDLYYSTSYSYFVSLVDEYGDPISDVDELKVIYEDGEEEIGECDEDSDYLFSQETIGNRKATIILTDSYYAADPVTINVKISKSPVKITTKTYYSNTKQYSVLKAVLKDTDNEPIYEGKVKFNINGKTYYAYVEDGVATKKIKLTKAKTYTYSATYIGNDHYKDSKTSSSKIYVYGSSKKDRTFYVKGYKVTLTQNQYNKLINAKNTNKLVTFEVKTNKYITQTYQTCKITEKWVLHKKDTYPYSKYYINDNYKVKNYRKIWFSDGEYYVKADIYKKVSTKNIISKTVKARVSIIFSYGGKNGGQYGFPNKYSLTLTTPYQNPGYDTCKPWLYGAKKNNQINTLNKAKVTKW